VPKKLPAGEAVLGRTRGGRQVKAQELVDAIRKGWPGTMDLCGKHNFDTHTTAMAAWLKQCTSLKLLVRDGKGYAVTSSAGDAA
jgi:hypothetical protein